MRECWHSCHRQRCQVDPVLIASLPSPSNHTLQMDAFDLVALVVAPAAAAAVVVVAAVVVNSAVVAAVVVNSAVVAAAERTGCVGRTTWRAPKRAEAPLRPRLRQTQERELGRDRVWELTQEPLERDFPPKQARPCQRRR